MLRSLVVVLCLCLSQSATAGSLEDLDKKKGFRDVVLGTSVTDYPRMQPVDYSSYTFMARSKPEPPVEEYFRPSDKRRIGDALLGPIVYQTWNGVIFEIVSHGRHEANALEVSRALKAAYGEPAEGPALLGGRTQVWSGEIVQIMLHFLRHDRFALTISHTKLKEQLWSLQAAQRRRKEAEAGAKAAEDL
jgi:hypothetical protein